jgi:hypothetical protein
VEESFHHASALVGTAPALAFAGEEGRARSLIDEAEAAIRVMGHNLDMGLRLSSSTWTRAQKDSIIALSTQSPIEPIEGSRPDACARWVNAQDPNCTP